MRKSKIFLLIILFSLNYTIMCNNKVFGEQSDNITIPLPRNSEKFYSDDEVKKCEWARIYLNGQLEHVITIGPKERHCIEVLLHAGISPSKTINSSDSKKVGNHVFKETKHANAQISLHEDSLKKQLEKSDSKKVGNHVFKETKHANAQISLHEGSLKKQLEKYLNDNGWKTPSGWWMAENDYYVPNKFLLSADNLYQLFNKLLSGYGLRIFFYKWDKTVKIVSIENIN